MLELAYTSMAVSVVMSIVTWVAELVKGSRIAVVVGLMFASVVGILIVSVGASIAAPVVLFEDAVRLACAGFRVRRDR